VLCEPPNPGGELPRGGVGRVSEVGEVEVVSAAGVRVDRELILEDEGAVADDVVDGDEALECHGGVVRSLQPVHQNLHRRRGCGSWAVSR